MLYKYLNPNLIAVGTEVTPDTKPGISIYLIDAVTGINVMTTSSFFSHSQSHSNFSWAILSKGEWCNEVNPM